MHRICTKMRYPRTYFFQSYGGRLRKEGLAVGPAWMTSLSVMCSQTTRGMARGSLVHAVSLNVERLAMEEVC